MPSPFDKIGDAFRHADPNQVFNEIRGHLEQAANDIGHQVVDNVGGQLKAIADQAVDGARGKFSTLSQQTLDTLKGDANTVKSDIVEGTRGELAAIKTALVAEAKRDLEAARNEVTGDLAKLEDTVLHGVEAKLAALANRGLHEFVEFIEDMHAADREEGDLLGGGLNLGPVEAAWNDVLGDEHFSRIKKACDDGVHSLTDVESLVLGIAPDRIKIAGSVQVSLVVVTSEDLQLGGWVECSPKLFPVALRAFARRFGIDMPAIEQPA